MTTRFLYDGASMIAEYDGSNVLLRRYVPGPGVDEPVVWYEGSVLTNRRFYHADERGSIIATSDGSGTVTINRYDEYGIPASTNVGRFQYTGQAWLPELGLYHYKARIYSPKRGRFMQADPIGYDDGVNMYAYVGGDPVNLVDPSGLSNVCYISKFSGFSEKEGFYVGFALACVEIPDVSGPGGRSGEGGGGAATGEGAKPQNDEKQNFCAALTTLDIAGTAADGASLALGGAAAFAASTGAGLPVAGGLATGAAVANGISRATSGASFFINIARGDAVGTISSAAGFLVGSKSVERGLRTSLVLYRVSLSNRQSKNLTTSALQTVASKILGSGSTCRP